MKQIEKEVKMNLKELSKEELKNIYGGSWWEVRIEKDKLVFTFHPYDDNKPK